MQISEDDIKLIVRLISEKLGANASPEKVKLFSEQVIALLSNENSGELKASAQYSQNEKPIATNGAYTRKLIIAGLGPNNVGLEEYLRSYLANMEMSLIAFSTVPIDKFNSLVAVIDYAHYGGDINRLKFELSELCDKFGFKAIIQDSSYYSLT